ncbi:MAG: hypothetical protein ISR77_14680 [Pirellulaceae bacterium]|nr:hypothetical protein [Pirellulaceae bacterium]
MTAERHRDAICCSCREGHPAVGPLIEGPDAQYMCWNCAALYVSRFADASVSKELGPGCSFCQKTSVAVLPAGPNDTICQECADLFIHIFQEETRRRTKQAER